MGQNPYDGSIAHFPDHGGSVGCSRRKHSLAAWVAIQAAEVIPWLICWFGLKHSATDSVRHEIQFLQMIYDFWEARLPAGLRSLFAENGLPTVDCQHRLGGIPMNWHWSHYQFETELFSA